MMRQPPPVMLWCAPFIVACGIAIVIGIETGSIVAWCAATGTGVVLILVPMGVHYYMGQLDRIESYFAVTTLNLNEERRSRLVGCFQKLEEAQQCCRENWGDIYENGWYPYVVVEELEWGLYPDSIGKRWFYNWQGTVEDGGFVECEPPEEDAGICSYYG